LDGIQGPVYVGTGCVFNRTALYGNEPPLKPKHKKKSSKFGKKGSDKRMSSRHTDPSVPIYSLGDMEGVEGRSAFVALIVPSFKLFLPHLMLSFSIAEDKYRLLSCFYGALYVMLKLCLPNHTCTSCFQLLDFLSLMYIFSGTGFSGTGFSGTRFSGTGFSGSGFYDEKTLLTPQKSLEMLQNRFGQSIVFVVSTEMENGGVPQSATPETLLKEAIHVISCGYEDKSEWGTEVRCYLMLNNIILCSTDIFDRRCVWCPTPPQVVYMQSLV
jgi:hypothetical protein